MHGKSAVRCDTDGQYVPPTVHMFLPRTSTGAWDEARLRRCCHTNDPRNAIFAPNAAQRSSILHYAIWDPHALWAKYHLHGEFPDEIAGATTKGGMVWGRMFHTHCRDYYLTRRHEPDGGRGAMHDLFRRAAALEDEELARRQIRAGVLSRVQAVIEVVAAADDTPSPAEAPQLSLPGGGAGAGQRPTDPTSDGEDDALQLEENGDEEESELELEDNDACNDGDESDGVQLEENGCESDDESSAYSESDGRELDELCLEGNEASPADHAGTDAEIEDVDELVIEENAAHS